MLASAENNSETIHVIKKAISYGLNVNAVSKRKGNTALHLACLNSFGAEVVSCFSKAWC